MSESGPPREQEHVLGGSQRQHRVGQILDAEDDEPARGLLHLAAEVAGDLVGRDGLDPAVRHGVERRKRLVVGRSAGAGHGVISMRVRAIGHVPSSYCPEVCAAFVRVEHQEAPQSRDCRPARSTGAER